MTGEQAIAFAILAFALCMFVWGRWRYDVVAVLALLGVVLTGLVPAETAFDGFAHPAVITVAAVLIISRGLQNAGIVDAVIKAVSPLRGRPNLQIAAQCGVIAVLSSFMNNVGALALMLPVAMRNAYREGYPPARSLMPLAFASLLGGLTTLIGTPPNIIVAAFREQHFGQSFGMFAFTPVGLAVAIAGLLFLILLGRFLLPRRGKDTGTEKAFSIEGYVAEMRVPEKAKAVGMTVYELEKLTDDDVAIAAIIHADQRRLLPSGYHRVAAGDVLVVRGDTDALKSMIDAAGLELAGEDHAVKHDDLRSDDIDLVEAVVSPGSRVVGGTPETLQMRSFHGVNLLAIARQGRRIDERLGHVTFHAGDVMLLQGPRSELPSKLAELGLLPLAERPLDIDRKQRLAVAGVLFLGSIALIIANLVPVQIAFTTVAAGFVVTGIVRPTDIYAAIDWPVIVLLGALFPVATALQTTGAAALVAEMILLAADGFSAATALLVLLVVTMLVSDLMNNNATALLMAPIATTLASRLGVSADPFLMAVALGASCAFLTPIGHQSNALVMEPGGYRFGDYWRIGLPLEIVILAVAFPLLLIVWPL